MLSKITIFSWRRLATNFETTNNTNVIFFSKYGIRFILSITERLRIIFYVEIGSMNIKDNLAIHGRRFVKHWYGKSREIGCDVCV